MVLLLLLLAVAHRHSHKKNPSATEEPSKPVSLFTDMLGEMQRQATIMKDFKTVKDIIFGHYTGTLPVIRYDGAPVSMYDGLYIFRLCGPSWGTEAEPLDGSYPGLLEMWKIRVGDQETEAVQVTLHGHMAGYLDTWRWSEERVRQMMSAGDDTGDYKPLPCMGYIKGAHTAGRFKVYDGWVYVKIKEMET